MSLKALQMTILTIYFLTEQDGATGLFSYIQKMGIHCGLLNCFPVEHFPKLKQLDISGCSYLESLCLSDGSYTSTSPLKLGLFPPFPRDTKNKFMWRTRVISSFGSLVISRSSLAIHDCQKLFARLEELDLKGFSLTCCELRGISSSTTTHLPM
uniref:Uncharacterized protein n=1 Tax=Salix viminalis TaxID=40686 RepID=A0A6N2NAG0_SALVM